MSKESKTNAMRILDRLKISYETVYYECDKFIDGIHTADLKNVPHEQSYKTLCAVGKSRNYYVFVIPIEKEVDLKKAAKAVKEKSIDMLPLKELTKVTGYVLGGVSPLGMKKAYPVVVQQDAASLSKMYISGGRIGATIVLTPSDLIKASGGCFADITC